MSPVVEVEDLTRIYRTFTGVFRRRYKIVEAVRDLSFSVEPGELFGLLGPNGAGKTTTIKVLNTLLLPTAGSVRILGFDVAKDPQDVRRRIGYVFGGDRGLYNRLSALDNLRYFSELYGLSPPEQRTRIGFLLDLVNLTGRENDRVEVYSRGMRQRLHIARGLLHDPDVLFLDEPTSGIDPVGARDLRETVSRLAKSGKTIVLTTHYMFEADELCDRIAVIRDGEVVGHGTPAELKKQVKQSKVIEIETFGVQDDVVSNIRILEGVLSVTTEEHGHTQMLAIQSDPSVELTKAVLSLLDGTRVGRVISREPTLEDAYITLVNGSD